MKKRITTGLVIVAAAIALIALTTQVGRALPTRDGLQPPFQFVVQPQTSAPALIFPPAASRIIMTETFGVSFAPTATLSGTTPLWRVWVNPDDAAGYYWDRVDATQSIPYADSVWHATRPITSAVALTPGTDGYPAEQDTWLLYGPVSLSGLEYVQLSFEYNQETADGDLLRWGISTDGVTFSGNEQTGSTSGWMTNTYSLILDRQGNYPSAYIAFAFKSGSAPSGLGAFVRNVTLAGEPAKLVYLPLAMKNYPATPTPTPTATPLPAAQRYTFDPGTNDMNIWGGVQETSLSTGLGPCNAVQFQRDGHGNPGGSLALNNSCKYLDSYASPNTHTPQDFELVVQLSPWRLYGEDLFGVTFNASDSTFGPNGAFNNQGDFYRVNLATNVENNLVTAIMLERCSRGCAPLTPGYAGLQPLPAGLVTGQSAYWDELRILRIGSNIKVYVNGSLQIDLNDGTFVNNHKFGVHVHPLGGNDAQQPPVGGQMEIDFDNITVYAR